MYAFFMFNICWHLLSEFEQIAGSPQYGVFRVAVAKRLFDCCADVR